MTGRFLLRLAERREALAGPCRPLLAAGPSPDAVTAFLLRCLAEAILREPLAPPAAALAAYRHLALGDDRALLDLLRGP